MSNSCGLDAYRMLAPAVRSTTREESVIPHTKEEKSMVEAKDHSCVEGAVTDDHRNTTVVSNDRDVLMTSTDFLIANSISV